MQIKRQANKQNHELVNCMQCRPIVAQSDANSARNKDLKRLVDGGKGKLDNIFEIGVPVVGKYPPATRREWKGKSK